MSASPTPFPIEDPCRVPRERYFEREFFEAERERLWPRVWQMACRLEEIPEVGDFVEYTIIDQSVFVVRHGPDPGDIAAYHNVCPHRATQLAVGSGRFRRQEIACPFHGWRWKLDGTPASTYGKESFQPACVTDSELALKPCRLDTWGGCVFINLDPDARPLLEQLAPIPSLLDPLLVGDMKVRWWKGVQLQANWKMAQEAFLEGWHVMETHPQLTLGQHLDYPHDTIHYLSHENGNFHFESDLTKSMPAAKPEEAISNGVEFQRVLGQTFDAYPRPRDIEILDEAAKSVTDPALLQQEFMTRLFEAYAAAGTPLPQLEPAAYARWGGVFFVFPNYFILPMYGSAAIYRCRPDGADPERTLFEVWAVTLKPADEPVPRARFDGVFDKTDVSAWPQIPRQDFSNIERQQRGLHSAAFSQLRLSRDYEHGISNMHREVDGYLAR